MLLNQDGVDVTKRVPERFKNERERIAALAPLREVLTPNREHCGKMFRIEERAKLS